MKEKLAKCFYSYFKTETEESKQELHNEWESVMKITLKQAKEKYESILENEQMKSLLAQMTDEQKMATYKYLQNTLTLHFLEQNALGTDNVIKAIKKGANV